MGNIAPSNILCMVVTVHPHVCGEHFFRFSSGNNSSGSSPRVWGTLQNSIPVSYDRRFIPTCVGNIGVRTATVSAEAVHPHVCGEHTICGVLHILSSGSSPRVWGTLKDQSECQQFFRFIPTCVGNITTYAREKMIESVHPHVCGEHIWRHGKGRASQGSSPRVWGTYTGCPT